MVVAAQRLDHRAARGLAIVARLGAVLQLRDIRFVALGAENLTSRRAGRAGVDHQRALAGHHRGRQIAERGAVGNKVQGRGKLLLALGECGGGFVERLVAHSLAGLAVLEALIRKRLWHPRV